LPTFSWVHGQAICTYQDVVCLLTRKYKHSTDTTTTVPLLLGVRRTPCSPGLCLFATCPEGRETSLHWVYPQQYIYNAFTHSRPQTKPGAWWRQRQCPRCPRQRASRHPGRRAPQLVHCPAQRSASAQFQHLATQYRSGVRTCQAAHRRRLQRHPARVAHPTGVKPRHLAFTKWGPALTLGSKAPSAARAGEMYSPPRSARSGVGRRRLSPK
jgi:hypothetical protein